MKKYIGFILIISFLASCTAPKTVAKSILPILINDNEATAEIFSTANTTQKIGNAFFTKDGDSVKMILNLNIKEKAAQTVAVHFHEHGDCGDKGNSTHGHWNPTGDKHGSWGSSSYHSGDIGNILLDANGNGKITVVTDKWNLNNGVNKIRGLGIIVHGGIDDYNTQPTGNSGPRIGCGVIR